MTGDTKDWANIRIEEPVRDEARADERTYTEIMRDGLDADARDEVATDAHAAAEGFEADIPDDVRERLDDIYAAAKEATNAAQSAEAAVENMGAGR